MTCFQSYIGETSNELHIRMNGHRSQVNNDNVCYPSYEIKHFKTHGFKNIQIEILAHVEDERVRLKTEDELIFEHRTLYPYGLNVKLSNHNIENFGNIYHFLNRFNNKRIINRNNRGSGIRSFQINLLEPHIWIKTLESDFISTFSVHKIKTAVFALKIRTINKIKKHCSNYNFSNTHFKDVFNDLLDFRSKTIKHPDGEKVYFTLLYQQKSFDEFKLGQLIKQISPFFPIKNVNISITYRYTTPLSKKFYNYREITNLDNDLPDS